MPRYRLAVLAAVGLSACQSTAYGDSAPVTDATLPAQVADYDALSFAQGACADCHAVEPPALSPNPEAPAFADIANRKGLTEETLAAFLRDAHNYPEAMDFDLTPDRVDDLSAYILTLRDENYRPPTY